MGFVLMISIYCIFAARRDEYRRAINFLIKYLDSSSKITHEMRAVRRELVSSVEKSAGKK